MDRLAYLFIILGLVGCAVGSAGPSYHALDRLNADDGWREKLRVCGSAIGPCGVARW